jgi:SAM-dependent methyltransferase
VSEAYVHGYGPREKERLQDQAGMLVELLHSDTSYPSGSVVLEAGCGVGAQTVTLAQRSPSARFTSVDVSANSLAEAKRETDAAGLSNVQFQQADIFALPFGPASFDHVFVCFVLEHVSQPVEALALAILNRLLRPGGTMTVIEGDHGSTYFHPDSSAAHLAIQSSQVAAVGRRQRVDWPAALSTYGRGGSRGSSRVSAHGVRGFEQTRSRRWLHQEDVHGDDRGRSGIRDQGRHHRSRSL